MFGGVSSGGAGGKLLGSSALRAANGGDGGDVTDNTIQISHSLLTGAAGGRGSEQDSGGGGRGGQGGGSVFGGISHGGAAGGSHISTGGSGGSVTGHVITLDYVTLRGADGGNAGSGLVNSGSTRGGMANGGDGGGSVFGGISSGGGGSSADATFDGGDGGAASNNQLTLNNSQLHGAAGGEGGYAMHGGAGNGGYGGASVFGGVSLGGAGGHPLSGGTSAKGGQGGDANNNTIYIAGSTLEGGSGGRSGEHGSGGGATGGHGGGSIFGGLSHGGAAGIGPAFAQGGDAGTVSNNTIAVLNTTLNGAAGGQGTGAGTFSNSRNSYGGSSDGGHGGGSIFGGVSSGGNAGSSSLGLASGGNGNQVTHNKITVNNATLTGGNGGTGADNGSTLALPGYGGGGNGGHGGGSLFGGLSSGGNGGSHGSAPITGNASGGHGGDVTNNTIFLQDSTLDGGDAGLGGVLTPAGTGGNGHDGLLGGSVFGGVSRGGSGGSSRHQGFTAMGGDGGNTTGNEITLAGTTSLTGNVYGGYSQGGQAGFVDGAISQHGQGGWAQNNTITLIGNRIEIDGAIYGGYSANGDGSVNDDKAFSGNTLNLQEYSGKVQGIYNIEQYNWLLPADVQSGDTMVSIQGNTSVKLDGTVHTVGLANDQQRHYAGDYVVLIDKVEGEPTYLRNLRKGHFITYDAHMEVIGDELVLSVDGVNDNEPDGYINPKAKAFLEGRAAQLALVNQGADMISDYGIYSARASLRQQNANLFAVMDGGSNRYKTGSHIKLRDFKLALGAAKAFELPSKSVAMVGVFAEHGSGNYDSYNDFGSDGNVHGWGDTRYTGGGVLFHMDVEGTAAQRSNAAVNIFDQRYGLYINAALRAGQAKLNFDSNDLIDPEGRSGHYDSKSKYYTAMAGIGYVWNLDAKQAVDVYGRYTWSKLDRDDIQVGLDQAVLGTAHSSRLRLGARYSYVHSPQVTPYAGLAFERDFKGDVSGRAYDMSIRQPSLRGNTGIVELGMLVKPVAHNDALTMNAGVQGYFGQRKGATVSVKARYVF